MTAEAFTQPVFAKRQFNNPGDHFRCPVEGCEHSRASGLVMCRPCWRKVPHPLQADIFNAWSALRAGDQAKVNQPLLAELRTRYFELRAEAIQTAGATP